MGSRRSPSRALGSTRSTHSPVPPVEGPWGDTEPAPRKSASRDSYLGEATENAQYMCWSQFCPLPWCLSHVEYNPTVTGMGIRVSMSSSKTLPLQSKPKGAGRARNKARVKAHCKTEEKGNLQRWGTSLAITRCSRIGFVLREPIFQAPLCGGPSGALVRTLPTSVHSFLTRGWAQTSCK